MSRGRSIVVLLCGIGLGWPALADDNDAPDEAFIEFLGSWEGDDDAWLGFIESLPGLADDYPADGEMPDRSTDSDSG